MLLLFLVFCHVSARRITRGIFLIPCWLCVGSKLQLLRITFRVSWSHLAIRWKSLLRASELFRKFWKRKAPWTEQKLLPGPERQKRTRFLRFPTVVAIYTVFAHTTQGHTLHVRCGLYTTPMATHRTTVWLVYNTPWPCNLQNRCGLWRYTSESNKNKEKFNFPPDIAIFIKMNPKTILSTGQFKL